MIYKNMKAILEICYRGLRLFATNQSKETFELQK